MNIGVLGGGVMGEAFIAGLLAKKLTVPDCIAVSDPEPARLKLLDDRYGVKATPDNEAALAQGEIVILAVKPQTLDQVFADLHGKFRPDQLLLSIVAGARIQTLAKGFHHDAVVRSMPNTPAQIGHGMTIWTATPTVTPAQRKAVRSILLALGKEIEVHEERYIDMATAVSGNGPAYVALIVESLIDAGVHIGLPRQIARELVLQTLLGSTLFAEQSAKHPAELRNMVTSPGGTTTESLLRLEEGGFRALIIQAVIAGYEKAKRLGGQ